MIWPVGESTKMAIDTFPGCALVQSTQASTMALAVSALMTAFINVFLATSDDTVTLLNGAGVEPWAQAAALPKAKAATATAMLTATRKNRVCFVMIVLPHSHMEFPLNLSPHLAGG